MEQITLTKQELIEIVEREVNKNYQELKVLHQYQSFQI